MNIFLKSPNKQKQFLLLIIASLDLDSEASRIVRAADCGFVVDPEVPQSFVDAIRYLKSHPDECHIKGQNSRAYVVKNLRRNTISQQYELLFKSVVKANS